MSHKWHTPTRKPVIELDSRLHIQCAMCDSSKWIGSNYDNWTVCSACGLMFCPDCAPIHDHSLVAIYWGKAFERWPHPPSIPIDEQIEIFGGLR